MSSKIVLTHLNNNGEAHMVDVTAKQPTVRTAIATGKVMCSPIILQALTAGTVPKGDVLAVARISAIQAAKRVPELLPLAHTIGIHGVDVKIDLHEDHIELVATVRTADRTGVEMEALTAVTVGSLAIIDMVKGIDRSAYIADCHILSKDGGRSGKWEWPGN